ncbi:hypothetical protein J3F83DRAFT_736259 [Trichoderma novae-zelandiae]
MYCWLLFFALGEVDGADIRTKSKPTTTPSPSPTPFKTIIGFRHEAVGMKKMPLRCGWFEGTSHDGEWLRFVVGFHQCGRDGS